MNPNLRIFFKRSVYVLAFAILVAAIVYSIPNVFGIDLSTIGSHFMDGLLVFMLVIMGVLFTGLIGRVVWTGIMNRADTIHKCCPDKNQDGFHIVGSHYNPGGESTEGFSSYFHYYIDHTGKLYLSKKVEDDGSDLTKSIAHLSEQTRLQLNPDLEQSMQIGSHDDEEKKGKVTIMQVSKGELHFRGYEGLIDYGFKVSFHVGHQTKWRVTI